MRMSFAAVPSENCVPNKVKGGMTRGVSAGALCPSIYEVLHKFTAAVAGSVMQGGIALAVLQIQKASGLYNYIF